MELRAAVKAEFSRMLDGGDYREGFWQGLYEPSRQEMYRARLVRDSELHTLDAYAKMLEMAAAPGDVKAKRAARKAREKARKFEGVLRQRRYGWVTDPITREWQASVQWITDARDAAVYIQRMNNQFPKG